MQLQRAVGIETLMLLMFGKFLSMNLKMPKTPKLPNPPKTPFQSNSVWLFRNIHTNQVLFSPHRVIKVPLCLNIVFTIGEIGALTISLSETTIISSVHTKRLLDSLSPCPISDPSNCESCI